MTWNGFGRKWLQPHLWYYPGICMEGLKKITQNLLNQDSQSPGQDLNLGPPKNEAGVLTTQPRCLVTDLAYFCYMLFCVVYWSIVTCFRPISPFSYFNDLADFCYVLFMSYTDLILTCLRKICPSSHFTDLTYTDLPRKRSVGYYAAHYKTWK
jgi:hypothetical protein